VLVVVLRVRCGQKILRLRVVPLLVLDETQLLSFLNNLLLLYKTSSFIARDGDTFIEAGPVAKLWPGR
jgi:hypothetical protein